MAYSAAGLTDAGKIHSFNEDAFLAFSYQDVLFLAVADGLGSRLGKEVASVVALREVRMFLERYVPEKPHTSTLKYLMEQSMHAANRVIRSYPLAHEENYSGWGTSLTLLAINQMYQIAVAHVGNTRLYHLHNNDVSQLTKDHTEAQMEIDFGRLREDERWSHPGRSNLTRAMGMTDRILVDTFESQVQRTDLLLLTTDGIHGVLTDQAIIKIVYESGDTQKAVAQLIQAVNENGGPDNSGALLTYCEY